MYAPLVVKKCVATLRKRGIIMGVKICPQCGGKVSDVRTDCPHCQYDFALVKKCPDCEEQIDFSLAECPVCGHIFKMETSIKETDAPQPMQKIDNLQDEQPVQEKDKTKAEGKSPVAKNKKSKGSALKISSVLNIVALIALLVGIAFLVFAKNTYCVVVNGYGEIYNSYLKLAFSVQVLPLLTVISTIITFISLLIQLYFDISKTSDFKKHLILNLTATVFNIVAVVFGFIAMLRVAVLLFSIFASVCLLCTGLRLFLIIKCKTALTELCEVKESVRKALAIILSSALLCLVSGTVTIKEATNNDFDFDDSTFEDCDSLTSITIPNSVTSIGDYAFSGCSSLTSVVIGDSVTRIGKNAFRDCRSLTSITIPDGVTSIGAGAFAGCSSLTSIEIPYSVKRIGVGAFESCSRLTSVVIPDSITSIGDYVFRYCSRLTSVVIPDSVKRIGDYAFLHCYSLTSIKYRGTKAQWSAIEKGYLWNSGTDSYKITYTYTGD